MSVENGQQFIAVIILGYFLNRLGSSALTDKPNLENLGRKTTVLVFFIYMIYWLRSFGEFTTESVVASVFQSLLTSWLALGASFIVLAMIDGAGDLLRLPFRWVASASRFRSVSAETTSFDTHRTQPAVQPPTEQTETADQQSCQRVCSDEKFRCQLLYDQHANKLSNAMPRTALIEYFDQYFDTCESPDQIRSRSKELQALIRQQITLNEPMPEELRSLAEIRAHFQAERNVIASYALDEDERETLIAKINQDEDRAIWEFERA